MAKAKFEREIVEVPVLETAAAIKSAKATDFFGVVDLYDKSGKLEKRWTRGRPVLNFPEIEGDGGKDTILTMQISPFDQRVQTGWRSKEPNSKGKYEYCPAEDLVTYDCHVYDVGLTKSGELCRIADPSNTRAEPKAQRKGKRAGLPTA